MGDFKFSDARQGAAITVKVQPRARKTGVAGVMADGTIKSMKNPGLYAADGCGRAHNGRSNPIGRAGGPRSAVAGGAWPPASVRLVIQAAFIAVTTCRIWPVSPWKSRNRRFRLTTAPIQWFCSRSFTRPM